MRWTAIAEYFLEFIFAGNRVDNMGYISYTPPVALRPLASVVIREVFGPRNTEGRNGGKKNGRNGAPAPQSRVSLSAIARDGVHSSG
jgi:hypothetical protein